MFLGSVLRNASEIDNGVIAFHGAIVLFGAENTRGAGDAERVKEIYTIRCGSFNQKVQQGEHAVFHGRSYCNDTYTEIRYDLVFCTDYSKFLKFSASRYGHFQEPPKAESKPETRFSNARLNLSEFSADDTLDRISI